MNFKILALLLWFTLASARVLKADIPSEIDETNEVYRQYREIDKTLKNVAQRGFKILLPYIMEAEQNMNLTNGCRRNMFELLSGVRRLSTWSIMFLDAMGKLSAGLLAGNVNLHGEYDQCVQTNVMKRNGELNFRGQFCSIAFLPPKPVLNFKPSLWDKLEGLTNATRNTSLIFPWDEVLVEKFVFHPYQAMWLQTVILKIAPMSLDEIVRYFTSLVPVFYVGNITMDVCLPSGCDNQDISQIMNYISGQLHVSAAVRYCLKDGDIQFWTPLRTFSVAIVCLLTAILLIATAIDYANNNRDEKTGKAMKVLQCFSVIRNFPKFASLETSDESLAFLHGVRTLSIIWVLLGHEYLTFAAKLTGTHVMNYYDFMSGFFSQIILNALLSVDTFFFMSGFFNGHLRTQMKIKGKKQPSIPLILAHRLLRIVPTLLISQLIYNIINVPSPYIYEKQVEYIEKCARYWWRDYLFINNLFAPDDVCMPQAWYISADTQLFLLSLLTVPMLLKSSKTGYVVHILLLFCANGSLMVWHYLKGLPPTIDATRTYPSEMMPLFQVYISPVAHLGPYFIGIILGHALASVKVIHISKKNQVIGWITAAFLFTSMLFMTHRWNAGIPYTTVESMLYGAFSKSVYTLSLAWLTIACKFGYGGIVNYFLSLKIWFPMSKLTFMLYLISPLIQMFYHANLNFPSDFKSIVIVWSFLGSLFVSILVCIFLVLIVESPFIALEKVIFGNYRDQDKEPKFSLEDEKQNSKKVNGNNEITTVRL